jgi:hypothetical protein
VDETGRDGRRVDEETLRYLAGVLGAQSEVSGTSLFPMRKQETLVVSLDTRYYPDRIQAVQLELRAYTNGDFHVSYLEDYLGEVRQCRWDRHTQSHNTRDHFHPFPAASTVEAEDRAFPDTIFELLQTVVLPWVQDRLGEVWED